MPQVRTPALVLHSFAYGDTSRILRLLTRDFGVRSLIARGARSPRSRFGSALEPFTEGDAHFNLRENRDLLTLSTFSLTRSRQSIGRDLLAFAGASLAAELVLRYATDEAQPELYDAVIEGLDRLTAVHSDTAAASLTIVWNVIATFGFQPRMDSCVDCGRDLEADEAAQFSADRGGVSCLRCRAGRRPLPPLVMREVAAFCEGGDSVATPSYRAHHGGILEAFLTAHVVQGRPLRALPVFLELLRSSARETR